MPSYDLKSAVVGIRKKRMNFALYKGSEGGQVLITAKPAGTKVIAEIEKETGSGKRLAKGLCFFENDVLVFSTKATPAPSWETIITKTFKDNHCSTFLPVTVRQMGADESDEVVTDETGDAAAPAAGEAAAPGAPVAPPPPTASEAPASAAEEAASPAGPAAPPPASLGSEALEAYCGKLKAALTPRINAAITANPASKGELLPLLKAAVDREKAGDFAGAVESFKQLAAAVAAAPAPTPAAAAPPATDGPSGPVAMPAEIAGAVNRVAPDIKKLVAANPEVKNSLLHQVAAVQAAIKGGDPAEAAEAVAAIEARIARLNALAAEPPPLSPEETAAALEGALKKYADARGTVIGSLKALESGIRGMNDPEGDAAIILVKSIQAQLSARPSSLRELDELERYLNTDDVIAEAESPNDLGVSVVIRETLLPTLASIREVLAA